MNIASMSQQERRWVVALVWMAVGVMLIWRGLPYVGLRYDPAVLSLSGNDTWIALGIAVVVGIGKGFTLLRKGARRGVANIVQSGELAPMWTVFSPYMIVLVLLMIAFGQLLRKLEYDPQVKAWLVGILYPGIGLALIIGGYLATKVAPLEAKPKAA